MKSASAAGLIVSGVVLLAISAFAIIVGFAWNTDEPELAKPWFIGGFLGGLLGIGLLLAGLGALLESVVRSRRT